LRYDDWVDARRDPIQATEAAAKYFKQMYERFGSWPLVLAAYNAGDGAVGRAIRRTSSTDFWQLVDRGVLPTEATRYVPKIMAAMVIGRNPARYGFGGVQPEPALEFEVVPVPPKLDLPSLARRADTSAKILARLNPELKRGYTPPDGQEYPLRVPRESAEALKASLASRPPRGQVFLEHRVRFGESLRDIAKRYDSRRSTLRQLNDLARGQDPTPGAVLVVPKPDKDPVHPLEGELLVVLDQDVEFAPPGQRRVFFPVRQRFSVGEVAAAFGVTPGQIGMWNAVDPAAPLQRGMVLRLYVPMSFDEGGVLLAQPEQVTVVEPGTEAADNALAHAKQPRPPTTRRVEHTVKAGESLGRIASRYSVSVAALRAENGMSTHVVISPGDVLWVPVNKTPKAQGKARRRAPKREARGKRYTVRDGDSLGKIARKFGVDLDTLRRRNGMRRQSRIYPGQVLAIP
ncbi:MAG: LysM peptidoglycan-binding domain-containing protein, partial [Myxococcales bacterium]|nr:LysM peptidoglycan-binding domain-containing protein [Myxococcales bacterium]